ncbi:hypothetical protein PR202_ga22260 [Eleusine coracana subsp. coracana]|uniref:Strictosidine synthase conserved region domain-containing protein n=1 Tax=Eleusine coracana subsp. coracana TaxID=191504 RepID=A0AAV5D168_ELECO|nr:hypothetical protein QOZ80_9AG0686460 [Eleusine coracana subsp. coracana]GJN04693.1 hypothetical protein PR202_ga22260 [Eleusine coracana subsp. coracana]
MGNTSKLVVIAISILVLLLVPSAAAARVGPSVTKPIDASETKHLELPGLVIGPESVAFDKHGAGPYVSISDGRVLKYGGEGVGWTTFAYSLSYVRNNCSTKSSELPTPARESSCGRPLGPRFHRDSGYLYIADAYMGLMRVGPRGGEATVLATEAAGVPLSFTNGVDVDQVTGDVYFTSSSTTYTRAQHEMVTKTGDSTGRVLKYDPKTNQVTVLLSDVTYPNGISISADRTHLVVALTGPCKLIKFWLQGSKAGTVEPFTDLPGYPDNVRPDMKGGYWVALHREKYELPFGKDSHLLAIRIGAKGEKLQDIRGPKSVRPTEIVERDGGKIYLGSVELSYVSIVST